jgi:WD40 repeat protein
MNACADAAGNGDDRVTAWLVAYHAALVAGTEPPALAGDAPPEIRRRMERGCAGLHLLERLKAKDPPWTRLGRFEIRRELGRGGCGIVYLAHDPLLNRDVALKVPRAEVPTAPDLRERFAREARAAAGLDHPNILAVHEVGAVGPVGFLVLAYCPGISLAQWLKEHPEPIPFALAATLLAVLVEAVQHAHSRGVLHRDLKPSNVLLEPIAGDGAERGAAAARDAVLGFIPKLTDFGLAKILGQDLERDTTRTGAVLGTVSYMAPEQAAGRTRDVGPAADIYALGTILYELLTRRPPFQGESDLDTLRLVQTEEPVPPARLRPRLPRDLETICLKSLEKEPSRRYTAQELAADLRRFLAGEPIRARPVGPIVRLQRWCLRKPALAVSSALAAASLAAVVILSIGFALAQRRAAAILRREQGHVRAALRVAEKQSALAERRSALLTFTKGLNLAEQGKRALGLLWMGRSLEILATLPRAEAADLEEVVRSNLAGWSRTIRPLVRLIPHAGGVRVLAVSPDGHTLLTAGSTARFWDLTTGAPLGPPLVEDASVTAVAFSPDGRLALTGGEDGRVQLWDVAARTPYGAPLVRARPAAVRAAAFSPDGTCALVGDDDGMAWSWDLESGQARSPVQVHHGAVMALGFGPDGRTIATAGRDATARLWEPGAAPALRLRHELCGHGAAVLSVAFTPDGTLVATGSEDRTVRVWKTATGELIGGPFGHLGAVPALAFSPDGRTLVTGARDSTIRFCEPISGKILDDTLHHAEAITTLAFNPGGRWLISGGDDRAVRIWEVSPREVEVQVLPHPGPVRTAALAHDGRLAATGGDDGTARLWNVATGARAGPEIQMGSPVQLVAFAPGGSFLTATARTVRFWDVATSQPRGITIDPGHEFGRQALALGPDGRRLLIGCREGSLRLWSMETGQPIGKASNDEAAIMTAALSPDGRTALLAGRDGDSRLWDALTGQPSDRRLRHAAGIYAAAFSPDGRTVATASLDRTARLWSVATGKPVGEVRHHGLVSAVAFSPDGSRLATASADHSARLCDLGSGRQIALKHRLPVRSVAFSADGRCLVTGCADKTARLWDAATGIALGPPLAHPGAVTTVALGPDGRTLLTAGVESACLRRVDPAVQGSVERIVLSIQLLTGGALDDQDVEEVLDIRAWQDRRHKLQTLGGPVLLASP